MVHEPGHAAVEGGVDYVLPVQAEHVAAPYAPALVLRLPPIRDTVPDHFTTVLDNHTVLLNVNLGEESPAVNVAPEGTQPVLQDLALELKVLPAVIDALFGLGRPPARPG
eukprot:CAMPEP_0118667396 /NCGR_PEP_ID=MMETSP0785-20121206/19765_1 /TAXON_ID=91992 /ORGANISM="Bolidomonas pacifica, Strain CCMP 1866" /LENGTH=109 /DNA_ID=CAMNT_0006561849 /DNA_START=193 /DNA_END=519 /DNA_ORIENTATION=+